MRNRKSRQDFSLKLSFSFLTLLLSLFMCTTNWNTPNAFYEIIHGYRHNCIIHCIPNVFIMVDFLACKVDCWKHTEPFRTSNQPSAVCKICHLTSLPQLPNYPINFQLPPMRTRQCDRNIQTHNVCCKSVSYSF